MTIVFKSAVVLTLLAILISLGSGLLFLFRDHGSSKRLVNALTVRITLSVILFLVILGGLLTGVITPNSPFSAP